MTPKDEKALTRSLMKKIGPVDLDLVIGEVPMGNRHILKLGGKRAEDGEALALKHEAEVIENTKLWKIFTETLRYEAQHRMFNKFETGDNMYDVFWSGKFLLHAISTFEHIIDACKNPLLLTDQKKSMERPGDNKLARKRLLTEDKPT